MTPTLLLIHGLNCTGKIFTHLHSRLPEHNAIFADYDSSQPIERSLEVVIRAIDAADPAAPVWIVGHSLGGILGYLLTVRYSGNVNLQGLISISTPFGGSSTASILRWFFGSMEVLRDLAPSSRIINEVTTKKVDVPFTSIISVTGSLPFISGQNDGVITLESQRATLAKRKVEVSANHFEVMQDGKMVETVTRTIFK